MVYEAFAHRVQLILESDVNDGARGEFVYLGLASGSDQTYLDFNKAEWVTPTNEYPEQQPRQWYYVTDRAGFFDSLRVLHPEHTERFLLESEA